MNKDDVMLVADLMAIYKNNSLDDIREAFYNLTLRSYQEFDEILCCPELTVEIERRRTKYLEIKEKIGVK